ncbi:MAG: sigma-70 family RNA polymerase sigma factor [Verrucomicrobia subdivision 3 bacterium]|nr:sigma-70 family RNA polymerase sigma factor [Limisphaerales bacterium]
MNQGTSNSEYPNSGEDLKGDSQDQFESNYTDPVSPEEVSSSLETNQQVDKKRDELNISTDPTMLDGLKASDECLRNQASHEFNLRYREYIAFAARKSGLNDQQALDIVNTVLEKVFRKITQYTKHKGRFRNWLWTVTKSTAIDVLRKKIPVETELETGGVSSVEEFEEWWRREEIRYLTKTTLKRMRDVHGIKTKRLNIFLEYAGRGRRAKDVAKEFQVAENAVRLTKHELMPIFEKMVKIVHYEEAGGGA